MKVQKDNHKRVELLSDFLKSIVKGDLNKIKDKINDYSKSNEDFNVIINNENINLNNNSLFMRTVSDKEIELSMTDSSFSSLCKQLNIPSSFARDISSDLLSLIISERCKKFEGKGILVRTKKTKHDELILRSIHSEKYSVFDNHDLINSIYPFLKDMNFKAIRAVFGDKFMSLKLASIDGGLKDDEVSYGVVLQNSETGFSSVKLEPFVHRKSCTNDAIFASNYSQRHINIDSDKVNTELKDFLQQSLDSSAEMWGKILELKGVKIRYPNRVIQNVSLILDAKKHSDLIIRAFGEEPDSTGYGIFNSLTRAAQSLPHLERLELERKATKILNYDIKVFDKKVA